MEIVVNLLDLEKSIKELEDYKKTFGLKVQKYVDKMVKLGEAEARANFNTAKYDGTEVVRVNSRAYKKMGTITASGDSVLFLEFGTGITYPNDHPEPIIGYHRGSWSEGPQGKGHWKDPKGWFYTHDKRSYGNPANKCMYNAKKKMEAQAFKVAKEVFK